MTKELQAIREALAEICGLEQETCYSTMNPHSDEMRYASNMALIGVKARKALAAIAAIDTLAAEPSEDARGLAGLIVNEWWDTAKSAALIEADRQKVRGECANDVDDTLTICGVAKSAGIRKMIRLAIMGGQHE